MGQQPFSEGPPVSDQEAPLKKLRTLRRQRLAAGLALPALILLIGALDSTFKLPAWLALALIFLFLGDLVLLLIFNVQVRRTQKHLEAANISHRPIPKLATSIILAVCWFVLDAFFFQQGIISVILILLAILWMTPSALVARRKDRSLLRFRADRAAAYFLAGVAALGVMQANTYLSSQRAQTVITAVRQYQQKYGNFPDQLGQITPEFLPSIPLARYSFMWNHFIYFKSGESARLSYVIYPPFLRRVYSFQSGEWGEMD